VICGGSHDVSRVSRRNEVEDRTVQYRLSEPRAREVRRTSTRRIHASRTHDRRHDGGHGDFRSNDDYRPSVPGDGTSRTLSAETHTLKTPVSLGIFTSCMT
jgi:hypothetical protein